MSRGTGYPTNCNKSSLFLASWHKEEKEDSRSTVNFLCWMERVLKKALVRFTTTVHATPEGLLYRYVLLPVPGMIYLLLSTVQLVVLYMLRTEQIELDPLYHRASFSLVYLKLRCWVAASSVECFLLFALTLGP